MMSKMLTEEMILAEIRLIREIRKKKLRSVRRITTGWDHVDVRDDCTRQLILDAYNNKNPQAMIDFEDNAFVNGTLELKFTDDYRVPRPIDERKKCTCVDPQSCKNIMKCVQPSAENPWQRMDIQVLDTYTNKTLTLKEFQKAEGIEMTDFFGKTCSKNTGHDERQDTTVNGNQIVEKVAPMKEIRMKSPLGYKENEILGTLSTPKTPCLMDENAANLKQEVSNKKRKTSQPSREENEEGFSEVRMLDFFDNLRQLGAITDTVNAKMNFGENSIEDSDCANEATDEIEKSKAIDDHPFSVIESIELFLKRMKEHEDKIFSMEEVQSMSADEMLFIGSLRNKIELKPQEVKVVNKLAIEFMEIRIKELEKKEKPTDHVRSLYYRFLLHKYKSSLGPIIQFLALAGKKKVRDVEWKFFVVVANSKGF